MIHEFIYELVGTKVPDYELRPTRRAWLVDRADECGWLEMGTRHCQWDGDSVAGALRPWLLDQFETAQTKGEVESSFCPYAAVESFLAT